MVRPVTDASPLPPNFRALVVEQLRHGGYTQARGCIRMWPILPRDKQRFDVVGIACEVATQYGFGRWDGADFVTPSGFRTQTLMPMELMRALGLNAATCNRMIAANDEGVPLDRLASFLEAVSFAKD